LLNRDSIVLKFGGASLATPDHFHQAAWWVVYFKKKFKNIIVVVSAMGDSTDALIDLAHQVSPVPQKRDMDMLISSGERISCALFSMALTSHNIKSKSFTGSQAGILTTSEHMQARIIGLTPYRIQQAFDDQQVAIVAGFQGVDPTNKEITTLGRGGSDITAVALASHFQGFCVFFKDVAGIYTEDPFENPMASFIPFLTFNKAADLIQTQKHQILQSRSIALAKKYNTPLWITKFVPANLEDKNITGTWIQNHAVEWGDRPDAKPFMITELL
jgi:aspartate kinase